MIFDDLGGQEAYFGSPGADFEDLLWFRDLGDVLAATKESHFQDKMHPVTKFLLCFVLLFFGVLACFNFFDFECPEAPFRLPFSLLFGSPGPLKKRAKVS